MVNNMINYYELYGTYVRRANDKVITHYAKKIREAVEAIADEQFKKSAENGEKSVRITIDYNKLAEKDSLLTLNNIYRIFSDLDLKNMVTSVMRKYMQQDPHIRMNDFKCSKDSISYKFFIQNAEFEELEEYDKKYYTYEFDRKKKDCERCKRNHECVQYNEASKKKEEEKPVDKEDEPSSFQEYYKLFTVKDFYEKLKKYENFSLFIGLGEENHFVQINTVLFLSDALLLSNLKQNNGNEIGKVRDLLDILDSVTRKHSELNNLNVHIGLPNGDVKMEIDLDVNSFMKQVSIF
jgi:hypothetical protein